MATDPRLFRSGFRAGTEIDGLDKTIEAGLIAGELLLTSGHRRVPAAGPPAQRPNARRTRRCARRA